MSTSAKHTSLVLSLCLLGHAAWGTDIEQGLAAWQAGEQARAVALWRPLAEAGDAESMLFLAFAYRTGRGVIKDDAKAFHWYRRAARAGMPEAQMELSLMYELGIGTKADPMEAAAWSSQATSGEFCPADLPAGGRLGER